MTGIFGRNVVAGVLGFLCDLTFLQLLQLVIVVVHLCPKFPIYNAKYLCYFQFYTAGFSGCVPYLLTWAG